MFQVCFYAPRHLNFTFGEGNCQMSIAEKELAFHGKNYTPVEDEFLTSATKLAIERGMSLPDMAKGISEILGRNWGTVYKRMSGKSTQESWNNIQEVKPRDVMERRPFPIEMISEIVEVKVTKVEKYGAFCFDNQGRSGLLPRGSISSEFVTNVSDYLKVGDVVKVMVVQDRKDNSRTELNAKLVGDIKPVHKR